MARNTPAVARLKSSARALSLLADPLMSPLRGSLCDHRRALPSASPLRGGGSSEFARGEATGRNVLVEAALVVFSDRRPLGFVALVHERQRKAKPTSPKMREF